MAVLKQEQVTPEVSLQRVKSAIDKISAKVDKYDKWHKNYIGDTALPCDVKDSSQAYRDVQTIARLPMIGLATDVHAQRIRVGGFEPGKNPDGSERADADEYRQKLWREVWQRNGLDSRQASFVHDSLAKDMGILMVSASPEGTHPVVTVESPRDFYLHPHPFDPRLAKWAVKRLIVKDEQDNDVTYAWYIDEQVEIGWIAHGDKWELQEGYERPVVHGMSKCPVVAFTWDGSPIPQATCRIDRLIGPQRVIDTLRFNLLVNAQTTAFRQKVLEGFDPILRDENGEPIPMRDVDGNVITDQTGAVQYYRVDPPQIGPNKMVYTPPGTKLNTLDQTSLSNYGDPLDQAISHFASVAQVPSSYFQGNMSRVSGAALETGNATQDSFLSALKAQFADGIELVFTLACEVMGWELPSWDSEVVWEDTAPISLVDLGDFASKAVPVGAASREFVMEHLPGSSPQKISTWIEQTNSAMQRAVAGGSSSTASMFGNRPMVNDNMAGGQNPAGNNIGNE